MAKNFHTSSRNKKEGVFYCDKTNKYYVYVRNGRNIANMGGDADKEIADKLFEKLTKIDENKDEIVLY